MSLPQPLPTWRDRWSGLPGGTVVLDLGEQPASDLFPHPDDPQPDPRYPVRLVLSETSNVIDVLYGTMTGPGSFAAGSSASIGISNDTRYTLECCNQPCISSNSGRRYSPILR